MDDISGLIQTVSVLAACVVFLATKGFELQKKKKLNGDHPDAKLRAQIKELHTWHAPIQDPSSGQPRFLWYEDTGLLVKSIDALLDEMALTRESHKDLSEAIKNCQARTPPKEVT